MGFIGFSSALRSFGLAGVAILSLSSLVGCTSETVGDYAQPTGVGESQDHLLAGRRLSETEAATLIRAAGFPESVVGKMLCTIKYESNFYERASHKNTNGTTDYGLFQVNSIHRGDSGCPSTTAGLYVAASNTRCAFEIYESQGINAWYGYKKHKSECDRYDAPSTEEAPSSSSSSGSSSSGSSGTDPDPGSSGSSGTDPGSSSSSSGSSSGTDPDTSGGTDTSAEGGCYSGTLDDFVDANTCVESVYDDIWYQCKSGLWYQGGDDVSGPYGACTASYPL